MSFFSRKQSESRLSPFGLLFSFALPLLLLAVFLGRQFLDFNDIGLSNGFEHPLTGWDHLLTMLAVGIWAAQLRGRAIWMLPLAFVSVMSLGGLAGASGLEIPNVDGIILLSCAVFSVLITRNIHFSGKVNVLIVAFFAFFHGFAHGQEISTSASLISYTLGFMLATLLLHGVGILVAKLVVLAITGLLTVTFSSSVLAEASKADGNFKKINAVVNPQQAVSPVQLLLTTRQANYQTASPGANSHQLTQEDFVRQDAGSGGQLSTASKSTKPPSILAHAPEHLKKFSAVGDYQLMAVQNSHSQASDKHTNQFFYPDYSSDCRNLDFKTYYPRINHTPGRHFLSNGVGLTSPPNLYCLFVVPRQFQNTSFSIIDTSSVQLSIAGSPLGHSSSKAHRLIRLNDLSYYFN